jgi:signal peptidase I
MDNKNILKEVLDWGLHVVSAVLIGLFVVNFIAQITIVEGNSMETSLQTKDILIVEKVSKRFGSFRQGDIVTIIKPQNIEGERSPIIKRIIGVENDTVEIKDSGVFVNGIKLTQEYTHGSDTLVVKPAYSKVTLKKDEIYVLGDNRFPGQSLDSRTFGPENISKVGGKALCRLWPLGKIGRLER